MAAWWRRVELNHRPRRYECRALTPELRRHVNTHKIYIAVGLLYQQVPAFGIRLYSLKQLVDYNEIMFHHEKNTRFPYLLAVLLLVLVINSGRSILGDYRSIGRLDQAKFQLESLKVENERLERDISYAKTPEYLQKAAVEELSMSKPGETILIVEQMRPKNGESDTKGKSIATARPKPLELWAAEFRLQDLYFNWRNKGF